jgi:hypothetical protein
MDMFGALVEAFPDLSFAVLGGAGRSPADYAALMDRADLLEVLLARGSSLTVLDGQKAVRSMMAFLGHIQAISVLIRRQYNTHLD